MARRELMKNESNINLCEVNILNGFSTAKKSWFELSLIEEKLAGLAEALGQALLLTEKQVIPNVGRDVRVVAPAELPAKPGLATDAGRARLLHDLASIELQAMELAVRTLNEFPDAPREFREQLADIAVSEGTHLRLCLKGLETLGHHWGDWPVHLSLWSTVNSSDSLLDRILIVHRYLEGSGLDAGDSILRRLVGVPSKDVRRIVEIIVREEVDHVAFGSRWYRQIADELFIDPERDFAERIGKIAILAPRRERLARELRLKAGFTETELSELEKCQEAIPKGPSASLVSRVSNLREF